MALTLSVPQVTHTPLDPHSLIKSYPPNADESDNEMEIWDWSVEGAEVHPEASLEEVS
jgi:hypothetical protein